jgi:sensor histidine kinase YesM
MVRQFDSTINEYTPHLERAFAHFLNSINTAERARNLRDSINAEVVGANRVFAHAMHLTNLLIIENARRTNDVASETLRHFLHSRLFVTVCLVLAIFISLGVNWLIARAIVRRLRIIQIAAERIAYGNLSVRIAMTEPDEIGRLARAFNRMTENLKETLNNLADEQIRERQAQLEALQAQLAPHFLFNCLTALGGLIMVNKERAIEFLEKLSYTYRYVLTHRQQHLVTLEEELNFVNAYTFLASIRFKDGFNVDTNVPNEYRQHTLPSMALQLLLENAVKHNIVSSEQPLRISLEIVSILHPEYSQPIPHLVVRNNIQRRMMSLNGLTTLSGTVHQTSVSDSTHLGLQNLQNRYKLLSNLVPKIVELDNEFLVMLPLVA